MYASPAKQNSSSKIPSFVRLSHAAGALSFPWMFMFYKRAWKEQSEHELTKINRCNPINLFISPSALPPRSTPLISPLLSTAARFRIVLMQHLDDLEDILEVCSRMPGKANKFQFSSYLKNQLPDLKLNGDTEDFLFQQVGWKYGTLRSLVRGQSLFPPGCSLTSTRTDGLRPAK